MNKRFAAQLTAAGLALVLILSGCAAKSKPPAKLTPEQAPQVRDQAVEDIKAKNIDSATEKLKQVTAVTPGDPEAQFLLGVALYQKKQYKEAIAAYEEAIKLDPKKVEAYNNVGNCYRDMGDADSAIVWYEKAISTGPSFSYAYTNLAGVYTSLGKTGDATKALERGTSASPGNFDLRLYLANNYRETAQKDKAISVLQQVLKDNPDYAPAKQLLEELSK